jgi:hypothetical protein
MRKPKDPPGYPGDEAINKAFVDNVRRIRLEKGLSVEQADALLAEAMRRAMTKRKTGVKLSPREVLSGKQYPGLQGKTVNYADHKFEEGILYIRVHFTDKTELCWRITTSRLLEEADLSDWQDGNFKQLKVFVQDERESE